MPGPFNSIFRYCLTSISVVAIACESTNETTNETTDGSSSSGSSESSGIPSTETATDASSDSSTGGDKIDDPCDVADAWASEGAYAFVVHGGKGSVRGAADINGDGLDDLIFANCGSGPCVVWGGHAPGCGSLSELVEQGKAELIAGLAEPADVSIVATPVGDVDGDGRHDIGISVTNGEVGTQEAWIVLGKTTALTLDVEIELPDRVYGGFNYFSMYAAGDINGDGISDLAISSNDREEQGGQIATIIWGRKTWEKLAWQDWFTPDLVIGRQLRGLGRGRVHSMGDINGDTIGDIVVSSQMDPLGPERDNHGFALMLGNSNPGSVDFADAPSPGEFDGGSYYGVDSWFDGIVSYSQGRDLDGDGRNEFIIWNEMLANLALIVRGVAEPRGVWLRADTPATVAVSIRGVPEQNCESEDEICRWNPSLVPDIDGDGQPDIIMAAQDGYRFIRGARDLHDIAFDDSTPRCGRAQCDRNAKDAWFIAVANFTASGGPQFVMSDRIPGADSDDPRRMTIIFDAKYDIVHHPSR